MKKAIKKLSLVKTVIANLTEEQASKVVGGNIKPTGKTTPTIPTK